MRLGGCGRNPSRGFLARCEERRTGVAQVKEFAARPNAGVSQQWVCRTDQGREIASKRAGFGQLRLTALRFKPDYAPAVWLRPTFVARKALIAAVISSR